MDQRALFAAHVTTVARDAETALDAAAAAGQRFDGIVFHAGTQSYYHADDHAIEFHPTPHFTRWAPVEGPDHLLLFKPGARPTLAQVVPRDYWYEPPAEPDPFLAGVLDIRQVDSLAAAHAVLGDVSRAAFVGGDAAVARTLGIDARAVEPAALLAPLDWARAFKTPYEVACIREAARMAARGHTAVRHGLASRLSERQLHATFLDSAGIVETQSPYTNIIAWDDRAAILHYQTKRTTAPDLGAVLLIDAGCTYNGYSSDITRTYVRNGAHPVFRATLDRTEAMQRRLVEKTRPGQSYIELHETAHREIGDILAEVGILRVDGAQAFERGLTRPFFPHGLGHHLGIQVHDIGGRQVTATGERREPPEQYPFLRTTRDLAPGHVVTIEPGIYFIPMLLEPFRSGKETAAFDWKLVDALVPYGGIRIEDDVLVTERGPEDLTRPFVPGHQNA